jgi:predicted enzyme related to lactoylglutathione lyase
MIRARFAHANIVAVDWRRLAGFYEEVFGCTPLPPERSESGKWIEDGTGVVSAEISGMHLRLPGYGDRGPTLEIYQYGHALERPDIAANRPGFGHIAFEVEDVEVARNAVLAAGGHELGKIVTARIPGAGTITFVYVTDPEGNIIELQHWSSKQASNKPQRQSEVDER